MNPIYADGSMINLLSHLVQWTYRNRLGLGRRVVTVGGIGQGK